jgi:hypothetical protein
MAQVAEVSDAVGALDLPGTRTESANPMWVSTSIDRVRRRLRGPGPDAAPDQPVDPDDLDDVVLALGRPELERFIAALVASLDPTMPRPDSPARLAGAVATALEKAGGTGRTSVTRSPAGLYTPEYWHVRVDGANGASRGALQALADGGRTES